MHEDLYALSSALIDLLAEKVRLCGTQAHGYLCKLLDYEADWVVNIDEDAFVWDTGKILGLVDFMGGEGFACCGCPDGGVVWHRFHNPLVPSPFFNVFHLKRIKAAYPGAQQADNVRYDESLKRFTAPFVRGALGKDCAYDMYEPYSPFFLWILRTGTGMLYPDADSWAENRHATIPKDRLGEPFLIHTWFARDWGSPPGRERILKAHAYCREQNAKQSEVKDARGAATLTGDRAAGRSGENCAPMDAHTPGFPGEEHTWLKHWTPRFSIRSSLMG
jgi:hypothetical protein